MPSEGLSVPKLEDKLGIRASSTGQLVFDNVELSAKNQLGGDGDGFKIAMMALDGGRIGIYFPKVHSAEQNPSCFKSVSR
mgnify:CR=1 FL=1